MQKTKLIAQLSLFITKINNGTFDTSTFESFFSNIRWENGLDSLMIEIAHFVAHQEKNRGAIISRLSCHTTISNYIESNNLNVTRNVVMNVFPKKVLQAISTLHGEEILKSYKLEKDGNYTIKGGKKHENRAKRILNDTFFRTPPIKPLLDKAYIIGEFRSTVSYLRGRYELPKLNISQSKIDEMILCISSILCGSKIMINDISYEPHFMERENKLTLSYGITSKYPSCGVELKNGSSIMHNLIELNIDTDDINYYEGASILKRDRDGDLIFS